MRGIKRVWSRGGGENEENPYSKLSPYVGKRTKVNLFEVDISNAKNYLVMSEGLEFRGILSICQSREVPVVKQVRWQLSGILHAVGSSPLCWCWWRFFQTWS